MATTMPAFRRALTQALQYPVGQWVTVGWPEDKQICWSNDPKAKVPIDAWLVPAGTCFTTRARAKWLLVRPARVKRAMTRRARVFATEQPQNQLLHYSGGPFDGNWDSGFDAVVQLPTGRWVIDDLYGAVQTKRARRR